MPVPEAPPFPSSPFSFALFFSVFHLVSLLVDSGLVGIFPADLRIRWRRIPAPSGTAARLWWRRKRSGSAFRAWGWARSDFPFTDLWRFLTGGGAWLGVMSSPSWIYLRTWRWDFRRQGLTASERWFVFWFSGITCTEGLRRRSGRLEELTFKGYVVVVRHPSAGENQFSRWSEPHTAGNLDSQFRFVLATKARSFIPDRFVRFYGWGSARWKLVVQN